VQVHAAEPRPREHLKRQQQAVSHDDEEIGRGAEVVERA
jgi:hypothetical protein